VPTSNRADIAIPPVQTTSRQAFEPRVISET
jgi:hypothetical protein